MGAYSRGLYRDSFAAGLKDDFSEWLSVSSDLDATIERLCAHHGVDDRPSDATGSTFWLALADLLHQYGLHHDRVSSNAHALIDSGLDLDLFKTAAESNFDLRARARLLAALRRKWSKPAKRTRKVPKLKPERFLMRRGDVFVYDTMGGNPNHLPICPEAARKYRFKRDAVNAFVCFNTARVFADREARYFIVPLALFRRDCNITFEDCIGAQMVTQCDIAHQRFLPLGGWMRWSLRHFKMVDPRKIGSVEPDYNALALVFGETVDAPQSRYDGPSDPLWMNHGMLSSVVRGHVWGGRQNRLESYVKGWNATSSSAKS